MLASKLSARFRYGRGSRCGRSIFLQPAIGLIRYGHFQQSGIQQWFNELIAKLGPVLPTDRVHEIKQCALVQAAPQNRDLILI